MSAWCSVYTRNWERSKWAILARILVTEKRKQITRVYSHGAMNTLQVYIMNLQNWRMEPTNSISPSFGVRSLYFVRLDICNSNDKFSKLKLFAQEVGEFSLVRMHAHAGVQLIHRNFCLLFGSVSLCKEVLLLRIHFLSCLNIE